MQLAMDKILYYNNKPLQGSPSAVIYLFGKGQYRTMSRSPIRPLYNLTSVIPCLISRITSSSGRFPPLFYCCPAIRQMEVCILMGFELSYFG